MRKDRDSRVVIVRVPDWPDAWRGWRFAGRHLVSPDGDKFTAERLAGLGWRQASEARTAARRAREQRSAGLVVGLRDRVTELVTTDRDELAR